MVSATEYPAKPDVYVSDLNDVIECLTGPLLTTNDRAQGFADLLPVDTQFR